VTRALLLALALAAACGPSRKLSNVPPHGSASDPQQPNGDSLSNSEPPTADAAVDARPCPRQCMDVCCEEDEICSHGRAPDDGTYAKCLRNH